jgi:hypothetical protein
MLPLFFIKITQFFLEKTPQIPLKPNKKSYYTGKFSALDYALAVPSSAAGKTGLNTRKQAMIGNEKGSRTTAGE